MPHILLNGQGVSRLAACALALILAPIASAQISSSQAPPAAYAPTSLALAPDTPRAPDGKPDLQGAVWATNYFPIFQASPMSASLVVSEAEAKAMVEKMLAGFFGSGDINTKIDPEVGDIIGGSAGLPIVRGERRTRLVVLPASGKVPLTEAARKQIKDEPDFGGGPMNNHEERPPGERCLGLSASPPFDTVLSYTRMRIVQTPDHVVIQGEQGDETRIIPFAASHTRQAGPSWNGDGIARWDGDTLVVETVGLKPEVGVRGFSSFVTRPGSKIVERFTRLSKDELLYQFTVEDPALYSEPWLAEYSFHAVSTGMFPSSCHEHNYSLPNILSGARVADTRVAAKKLD